MSIEEFRRNEESMLAIPLSQPEPLAAHGVATVEARSAFNVASTLMPDSLNAKLGQAITVIPDLIERTNNAAGTLQQAPPQGMRINQGDAAYLGSKIGDMAGELLGLSAKNPEIEAPAISQQAFRQTGPTAFGL